MNEGEARGRAEALARQLNGADPGRWRPEVNFKTREDNRTRDYEPVAATDRMRVTPAKDGVNYVARWTHTIDCHGTAPDPRHAVMAATEALRLRIKRDTKKYEEFIA